MRQVSPNACATSRADAARQHDVAAVPQVVLDQPGQRQQAARGAQVQQVRVRVTRVVVEPVLQLPVQIGQEHRPLGRQIAPRDRARNRTGACRRCGRQPATCRTRAMPETASATSDGDRRRGAGAGARRAAGAPTPAACRDRDEHVRGKKEHVRIPDVVGVGERTPTPATPVTISSPRRQLPRQRREADHGHDHAESRRTAA